MTEAERKILRGFICDRMDATFKRLQDDSRYLQACEQQHKSSEQAEQLLQRLTKEERLLIRRQAEEEIDKTNLELEEMYLQGLRDSVKIMAFLGAFAT